MQNAKNVVFEILRPRNVSKTSFFGLCDLAKRQKHCFRDFATPRRVKNIVFEALRPRNAPKTLFLKLCGPRFVPFRGLNDLSRARFMPLRGLNAHYDLALRRNHPTIVFCRAILSELFPCCSGSSRRSIGLKPGK